MTNSDIALQNFNGSPNLGAGSLQRWRIPRLRCQIWDLAEFDPCWRRRTDEKRVKLLPL